MRGPGEITRVRFPGLSDLQVVVNGIASSPVTVNVR